MEANLLKNFPQKAEFLTSPPRSGDLHVAIGAAAKNALFKSALGSCRSHLALTLKSGYL